MAHVDCPRIYFLRWGQIPGDDEEASRAPKSEGEGDLLQRGFYLANDGDAAYDVEVESFEIEPSKWAKSKALNRIAPGDKGFALVWLEGYPPFPSEAKWDLKGAMARAVEAKPDNAIFRTDHSVYVSVVYRDADGQQYRATAQMTYIRSQGLLKFGQTTQTSIDSAAGGSGTEAQIDAEEQKAHKIAPEDFTIPRQPEEPEDASIPEEEDGWVEVPRADWRDDAAQARECPITLRPAKAARLDAIAALRKKADEAVQSAKPQTPQELERCIGPAFSEYAELVFDRTAEAKLSTIRARGRRPRGYAGWLRSKCLPAVVDDVCKPILGQFLITIRYIAEKIGEVNSPEDIAGTRRALWKTYADNVIPSALIRSLENLLSSTLLEERIPYWEARATKAQPATTGDDGGKLDRRLGKSGPGPPRPAMTLEVHEAVAEIERRTKRLLKGCRDVAKATEVLRTFAGETFDKQAEYYGSLVGRQSSSDSDSEQFLKVEAAIPKWLDETLDRTMKVTVDLLDALDLDRQARPRLEKELRRTLATSLADWQEIVASWRADAASKTPEGPPNTSAVEPVVTLPTETAAAPEALDRERRKVERGKRLATATERWRPIAKRAVPFAWVHKAAGVDHKDAYNWKTGKLPDASAMAESIEDVLQKPNPPIAPIVE